MVTTLPVPVPPQSGSDPEPSKNSSGIGFEEVRWDWREHTVLSDALRRPTDISDGKGDPTKAERLLGWKAKAHMKDVIAMMVKAELEEPERRRAAEAMALDG